MKIIFKCFIKKFTHLIQGVRKKLPDSKIKNLFLTLNVIAYIMINEQQQLVQQGYGYVYTCTAS